MSSESLRDRLASLWVPIVFVLFWCTGYLVGKIGTRNAEPFTLLFWRFLAALAVLAAVAFATRAPWPRGVRTWSHLLVTGILLQTGQFAGVYAALKVGTSAGLAALVVSASPLAISALAVPIFGERLIVRQWLGLVVGLVGVGVAVAAELSGAGGAVGVLLTVAGAAAFIAGTLYQKEFGQEMVLRTGGSVQLIGATAASALLAAPTSGFRLPWTTGAVGAVLVLAVVNSIIAFSFYFWLLRTRGGGAATSYLFLVPPATALLAVPILGEPLNVAAFGGIALAAVGVAMVTWHVRAAKTSASRSAGTPGPPVPAAPARSSRAGSPPGRSG